MFQTPTGSLETTFQYLSLCGVCPNTLRDDTIPWTRKLSTAIMAIFPAHYFVEMMSIAYENLKDISTFVTIVGAIFEWTNFVVAILTPLYNASSLVKFFKIVEDAHQSIASLDIAQTVVPSHKVQRYYVYGCCVIPGLITMAVYAPYYTFYTAFTSTAMVVATAATLVKLKLMLLLLDNKFEILNDHFKQVSDQTIGTAQDDKLNVDDFISRLHRTKYIVPKEKTLISGMTVDKIHKFNRSHFLLCDAHMVINSMFSQVGLIMTLTVSYVFLKAFMIPEHLMYGFGSYHLYACAFFTMYLFISVLTSATNVKNNADKTGYMIHELLTEELPADVDEELQLFSHTLIHRKIGLSAEGFFNIDLKLVTKVRLHTLCKIVSKCGLQIYGTLTVEISITHNQRSYCISGSYFITDKIIRI
ncbi:uncharacterized protein LOC124366951 isoform X1 [Homalodisca vitripennis]|uniref:uncharacterized protein LOC124366951 isoform X1 n=1 Tax=Homalodisca vitripennis TaxID=197043 RepID=UPI001EE9D505|nr:uncharacterized protein LOC124366951 isoform X1 [Homalodisca vitripennis]